MGFKLVQMIAHTLLKGEIIQNYLKYVGTFKYLLKNYFARKNCTLYESIPMYCRFSFVQTMIHGVVWGHNKGG